MKRSNSRLIILFASFVALWSVLVMRAAWIQLIPNSRLEALKRRQFETTITLGNRRGDILDRNGVELAASTSAWSIFADPKIIEEPKLAARQLAEAMRPGDRVSEHKRLAKIIYGKIKAKNKRFVWLDRQVAPSAKQSIQSLRIKGIGFIEEPRRIYPNDNLMANVIGFVGQDGRGLEGIELKLNDSLVGAKKEVSLQRDARGRPLVVNGQVFSESPDGAPVQLTIDRDLQFVVERELGQAVAVHQAAAATAVVLDAQTSEILAMATLPTFNANEGGRSPAEIRRNRTVTDQFEPGSTMKTFVIAAAIESKKIDPSTKIFAEFGQMHIGKRVIREADSRHKFGWITATEVLSYSSNVGSTKIAQMLGDRGLRSAYERFGFGERSGIDLPGEVKGVLQPLPWHDHLLANVSFGHGLSASALQIANAYASIGNGGWLKRPYIVKSAVDSESGEVFEGKPKTIRRVLGDEAAAKMRLMLSAVTIGEGTGINARVPGFPVAGKTGTAQRVADGGRGYQSGSYISSFAGFLPANDPKFVIFVSIDQPQKDYYGSAVAAPVFSRIAQYAVRHAGLSPVIIAAKNLVPSDAAEKARDPGADASAWRRSVGLAPKAGGAGFEGESGTSVAASRGPTLGLSDLMRSPVAMLGGGEANVPVGDGSSYEVPDVLGLSLREAMEAMGRAGIPWRAVKASGQGFVAKQWPEAGRRWSKPVSSANGSANLSKIELQLTFTRN